MEKVALRLLHTRNPCLDDQASAVGYFDAVFGDIVHHDIVNLPQGGGDTAA